MSSHGSKVCCPTCGTRHVVRAGEIRAQRQIEFTCSSCGTAVSIAAEVVEVFGGSRPRTRPVRVEIKGVE
jgi:hypothetical protein